MHLFSVKKICGSLHETKTHRSLCPRKACKSLYWCVKNWKFKYLMWEKQAFVYFNKIFFLSHLHLTYEIINSFFPSFYSKKLITRSIHLAHLFMDKNFSPNIQLPSLQLDIHDLSSQFYMRVLSSQVQKLLKHLPIEHFRVSRSNFNLTPLCCGEVVSERWLSEVELI